MSLVVAIAVYKKPLLVQGRSSVALTPCAEESKKLRYSNS